MPNFNDLDMKDWKESEILTDSLWVIPERQKSGKHDNFYHGNFIPQIPHQFILRYTKKGGVVFDPFLGSGTTAYEAEALNRNFIGIDIQAELVEHVQGKLVQRYVNWIEQYYIPNCISYITPVLICKKTDNKSATSYHEVINAFNDFNAKNQINCKKLKYIEYELNDNKDDLLFKEVDY